MSKIKAGASTYKVVKDFINRIDGKAYRRGSTIDADAERAEVLLAGGFIARIEDGAMAATGADNETDAGI